MFVKVKTFLFFILTICTVGMTTAEIHHFKPAQGYHTYAVREPVLRIKPGDIIETHTLFSDYFTKKDGSWPGEAGPIYVERATPEDTLVVKIIKIRPNINIGRSGTSLIYGSLAATTTTPMLNDPIPIKCYFWKIDAEKMTASLDLPNSKMKQIQVTILPMMGRLATAPPEGQAIPGGVPANFGGNMDTSDAREGAIVYLPIFNKGAYFYFGDVHALQGDGEITGSGIETTAEVTLQLDLLKGKKIAWPRLENDEYIMVAGSVRPLIDAFRIAHVEMIKWLESDYGFDRWEALQVFSQVGAARVANVVDPNYTVVARFPKKYLPPGEK
ncbi:MAG: acetamidase [Candidatus Aminicenantes bacterium]|nr:acetamidase [Candidatus Aminicenantes bacterium]NIM80429.1 acetamidase [Candidatus Aminicenantes bacterium]NIN19822.1 acetamidase [Candidatus Aminicenantes bacterium]NIN43698.1 acetamidase [Candidatus Aminicenantes bacterium]NIN86448.1 acetamidase [Candidatus Aminicenantes bacterium]